MINNRTLSRRTFLRGTGVALALPLLDAMVPTISRGQGNARPPRRMIAVQTNTGILPQNFFPTDTGLNYTLTPYLRFLETFKDRMSVFSGVSHPAVDGARSGEIVSLRVAASGRGGLSQYDFARPTHGRTARTGDALPVFVLDVNGEGTQGMSFSRSGVKIPGEKSPAALFRAMFVQGNTAEVDARVADLRRGRSLLDFVSDDATRLGKKVGPADRDRLDQYFNAVRELERQLEQTQAWERRPRPTTTARPLVDESERRKLIERIRLMFDVARLAFESDSTRVVSLFINTYSIVPDLPGVTSETHSITHHGGRQEALDQLFIIESEQIKALASLLTGLNGIREGGEPLLDRTMVLYGTPMGNANSHANTNLPILIAGGGFRHAGHLAFDRQRNYPLPNLFVSMLQRMGIEADRFASSTGTMRGLEG